MDILAYDFVRRALLAGVLTAAVAPAIGMFLVTRRYTFMADTLAHVALAGAAVGAICSVAPLPAAAIGAVIAGLCIEELRLRRIALGDAGLMMFLSGGLAVAAALLTRFPGAGLSISGALFGSLTTVSGDEVLLIALCAVGIIAFLLCTGRSLFLTSLDEDLALSSGVRVHAINRLFAAATALAVALGTRTVGALLIGALIVLPALAAMQWGRGFVTTLLLSSAIGVASAVAGVVIAFYVGIPTGSAVVLCALLAVGFSIALRR